MNELPPETARALATTAVPTATATTTVSDILTQVHSFSGEYETIDYIYVLNDAALLGVFSLHELFSESPDTQLSTIMIKDVAFVHAHSDQENVAHLALAQNIKAVPVLDGDNSFLGVVTSDVILQILRDEHTEDILKYAGINFNASDTLSEYTVTEHYVSRIPWLILGLAGGILAAWVVEQFSATIAKEVALAAFIPAIVYIADAVGSQTQMVYVRSLTSGKRKRLFHVLGREVVIATAVGVTLSSAIGLLSYAWLQSVTVPLILASAVLATVYFSVVVAIILPWAFHKAGYDPAVATGPMATVIRDVSSLCIYFLIALALL
jgi:magnesium transporter